MTSVREQFERELTDRGYTLEIDPESGCYLLAIGGGQLKVSLENLERELAGGADADRVARFVDTVIASASTTDEDYAVERLYWALDANNYDPPPEFCEPVSDSADRVLVHLSSCGTMITWVTPDILQALGLSIEDAGEAALANLAREVEAATLETQSVNDMPLGYIVTELPFKAALILAPNLRQLVEPKLGWPVLAVAPDRDFLYLWGSEHSELTGRIGPVVVQEYTRSPYAISTEVYGISDDGVAAIGEYPVPDSPAE